MSNSKSQGFTMTTGPTERTMKQLRDDGWPFVCKVEKWNHHAGIRTDLLGFADVMAVSHEETLLVQATTGSNARARVKKILELEAARCWAACPGRLIEVWGWRKLKVKRGGKAVKWEANRIPVLSGHFPQEDYIQWHQTIL